MSGKWRVLGPFLWMAAKIIRIWDYRTGRSNVNAVIAHDLRILYPGQELHQIQRDFRVKRLGMALAVLCGGILCWLLVWSRSMGHGTGGGDVGIVRGDYGESDQKVLLEVQYGGHRQQMEMIVGARMYSREQIQQKVEEFTDALPGLILQENTSLEAVREDLYLAESYEGYPFLVSWYSGNVEYLNRNGKLLRPVQQPLPIKLDIIIAYEELEWERTLEVTLLPTEVGKPQEEELWEYLVQSEQASRGENSWKLPKSWKGQALEYRLVEGNRAWGIPGLFLIATVLVYLLAGKDLHRQFLDRQQELKEAYPELLHQITLYLGAGMTIRGSLQKIYEVYQSARESGMQPYGAAFEEVGYVCREMSTGVAEQQAYESWGKRTGLAEYIQLCTLLTQNLQKGSTLLVERLREENVGAQKEYLRHCKRISEEMQTKLLVPLVLMLVVVMLLILIPAFSMAGI